MNRSEKRVATEEDIWGSRSAPFSVLSAGARLLVDISLSLKNFLAITKLRKKREDFSVLVFIIQEFSRLERVLIVVNLLI